MRGDLWVLATRSMSDFASRVALHLKAFPEVQSRSANPDFFGKLRCSKFADGEMEVEVLDSLRGKDVFVFAACARNTPGLSVEENKIEIYHTIDAVKRSDAGRITLVEPYFSASRSDRTTRRNSVGFWVHYKTLMSLGVNHIITCQLHSDKSKTAVDPTLCAIDDIPVSALVEEYIASTFIKNVDYLHEHVQPNWLFCSVDAGGEKLARRFAQGFGTRLVIAHKQRNYEKHNTVESIALLTDTTIEGKEVWVVDDMIDTAGSVYALVKELRRHKVAKVHIGIIHAVFSNPAIKRLRELYDEGSLDTIVTTDTIEITDEVRASLPFLHVVSAARLCADIVMRVHQERSLSSSFDDFNAERHFSALKLFY